MLEGMRQHLKQARLFLANLSSLNALELRVSLLEMREKQRPKSALPRAEMFNPSAAAPFELPVLAPPLLTPPDPYVADSQIIPVLLEQGIVVTAVNVATGPGIGASYRFGVSASIAGQPRLVSFGCYGTYTVCTALLQQSMDGGFSFQNVGTAVDLNTYRAGNLTTFFAVGVVVPGAIYLLNIVTFTGTSIIVNLAVS